MSTSETPDPVRVAFEKWAKGERYDILLNAVAVPNVYWHDSTECAWEGYQAGVDSQRAELAALRADKERLDWLEKYGATPICSRTAIDAARIWLSPSRIYNYR